MKTNSTLEANKILGKYLEMTGDLNEAYFALNCVAVQITELHEQNTYFPRVQNRDNSNIKVKEPDWKKHLTKNT
jgi:hypothetical protein